MYCPFCQAQETKVIDSRLVSELNQVRRRRECVECSERFNTYEMPELVVPWVVKVNQSRVPFEEAKLRQGLNKALQKRPVSAEQVETAVHSILRTIRLSGEREISSQWIGALVMEQLRQLDEVAYVRFASVYRRFEDLNAFREEIQRLKNFEIPS